MIEEQKQTETNPAENQEPTATSGVTEETVSEAESPESIESQAINSETNSSEPEQTSESVAENEPQSSLDEENAEIISVLQQENANLRKLLDDKIEESKGVKAQYARLAADFDNFRKRTIKEKENLQQQAKKQVISDLLPVVDNFERARVQIKPANDGEKTIHNSYQGVYKTLVDCLKKMGVAAMRPEGQEFDPNFHEAMLREQTNEYAEGTVIEQLMRGYTLGEEVLRHAMVKVAVPAESTETSDEQQEITENSSDSTESVS